MQKVILVTGASSGIGKATAKLLLSEGNIVYCAARRVENMRDLEKLGGYPISMDVTDAAAVKEGFSHIIDQHQRIDVLINNAGFALYGAVEDLDMQQAKQQFDINLFAIGNTVREALPHMKKQGTGTIINVSSVGGKIYVPLGAWYHASKHALEGWSDCLRLELKPFGIRVVIVEPGVTKTELLDTVEGPLLRESNSQDYRELSENFVKTYKKVAAGNFAAHPDVIAKTMSKIVRAKRPKTRYPVGGGAPILLWLRRWLSDRIFDRIMMIG